MKLNSAGFSYQPNIIGKPDKTLITGEDAPLKRHLSYGFQYSNGGLDELIQAATTDGFLWTAAVLKSGGHRHSSKFSSAGWVGLDIDNCRDGEALPLDEQILPEFFLEHPLLKDGIAFGYYSPSHKPEVCHKYRLVLRLPKVIRDRGEYRLITQKLWKLLPGLDDCCDEVRLWFGNTTGTFFRNDEAVLDLDRLDQAFNQLDEGERVAAIRRALNPTLTLEERIARGWVSPGSAADTDDEADKEILGLLLPHLPVPAAEGSYNDIRKTLMAVADRWGAEHGTQVLDELGYPWPREKGLYETLLDLDRQTGSNYRFPSLIKETRELDSWKADASNEARLSTLQRRAFGTAELNVEEIANVFGTVEGFKMSEHTPPTEEEIISHKISEINRLVDKLFELELDISTPHFAHKQTIMAQLTGLGVRKEHLDEQLFDRVCAYLGADLKNTSGKKIEAKSGMELLKVKARAITNSLIAGLLLKNKDHVIYGDAGTGKTLFSLFMAKALVFGGSVGDSTNIQPTRGKILYIGSDSGTANEGILQTYLDQMGLLDEDTGAEFLERFIYRSADETAGTSQFNFNIHNLIWLKQLLEEETIDLVIIDSLKAVTAGTRYSIDERNIGDIMRLVQAIVLPKSTLVWIHHSNKSTSRSTHRAGGCTDIIEIPSAAIEMVKEVSEVNGVAPEYWCKIQKLRGSSHREFEISFDWEDGMLAVDGYSLEGLVKELAEKKTPLHIQILEYADSCYAKRFGIAAFSKSLGDEAPHRSNIGRACKELVEKGLIKDTFETKRGTFQMLDEGQQVLNRYQQALKATVEDF